MLKGLINFLARRDVCRVLIGAVLVDMAGWFLLSPRNHAPIGLGCIGTAEGLSSLSRTNCFFPHRAVFARDTSGTVVLDFYSPEAIAMREDPASPLVPLGEAWVSHRTRSTGWLAPVFRKYSHDFVSISTGPPLTPPQLSAFRTGYAALMPGWGMTGEPGFNWPAQVATGDGETWILSPPAAVHDVIAAAALVIAIASLAIQRDRLAAIFGTGLSLQEARIRAGLCPACGYDMTGLRGICPECGAGSDPPPSQ